MSKKETYPLGLLEAGTEPLCRKASQCQRGWISGRVQKPHFTFVFCGMRLFPLPASAITGHWDSPKFDLLYSFLVLRLCKKNGIVPRMLFSSWESLWLFFPEEKGKKNLPLMLGAQACEPPSRKKCVLPSISRQTYNNKLECEAQD